MAFLSCIQSPKPNSLVASVFSMKVNEAVYHWQESGGSTIQNRGRSYQQRWSGGKNCHSLS